jgi:RHS repeat-associated protein
MVRISSARKALELRPVAEMDDAGNLRSRFVYAGTRDVPDYMITHAADGEEEATYRLITDHLGSVRLVVDASTGEVAQRMLHDVWGNVLEDIHPGFQPLGFAGGLYDADNGFVRLGVRDYDPRVGRWIAKDPILFEGGQANVYVYVDNEPADLVDYEGRLSNKVAWHVAVTLVSGLCWYLGGGLQCAAMDTGLRTQCLNLEDSENYVKNRHLRDIFLTPATPCLSINPICTQARRFVQRANASV